MLLEVQCDVCTIGEDSGYDVISWWWSTAFYSPHSMSTRTLLKHFLLLSAEKLFGDVDSIFQQDLVPEHTAKRSKIWFFDHGATENQWSILKR